MMCDTMTRRATIAASIQSAACRRARGSYFGRSISPSGPRLGFALAGRAHDAAHWSDGPPVTAGDFVVAWQRLTDPALGASFGALLYIPANGKEITEGKASLNKLGVCALDDFSLRVTLRTPTAHFLKNATNLFFALIPRHAIQKHGASWTMPGRMGSCGMFRLHEWKPYDRIVLRKNPRYYDAARVPLEATVFLPLTPNALDKGVSIDTAWRPAA